MDGVSGDQSSTKCLLFSRVMMMGFSAFQVKQTLAGSQTHSGLTVRHDMGQKTGSDRHLFLAVTGQAFRVI